MIVRIRSNTIHYVVQVTYTHRVVFIRQSYQTQGGLQYTDDYRASGNKLDLHYICRHGLINIYVYLVCYAMQEYEMYLVASLHISDMLWSKTRPYAYLVLHFR